MEGRDHTSLQWYLGHVREQEPRQDTDNNVNRQKLIQAYLGLVVSLAKRFAADPEELLDAIQDGNVGLVKAAKAYDPSCGTFGFLAKHYIGNELKYGWRRRHHKGSWRGVNEVDQIPVSYVSDDDVRDDVRGECRALHRAEGLMELTRHLSKLTQHQQDVLAKRTMGHSLKEIATQFGCTTQAVSAAEQQGLNRLRGDE